MTQTKQQKRTALIKAIKKSKLLSRIHVLESLYDIPPKIKSIVEGNLDDIHYVQQNITAQLMLTMSAATQKQAKAIIKPEKVKAAADSLFGALSRTIYSDILHYARKQFDPNDPVQVILAHTYVKQGKVTLYQPMIQIGWFSKNIGRYGIVTVKN